jgi:ribosomal-protein-alanine N-acetyltransferase
MMKRGGSSEHEVGRAIKARELREDDAGRFIRAAKLSTSLHGPWVSAPKDRASFTRHLERVRSGEIVPRVGLMRETGALIGVVNVSNILCGRSQSCNIGYYALGEEGRGFMRQLLDAVVDEIFAQWGLHRIEANIQPGNWRSRRLLRRLGFRHEGFSPGLLWINGAWRDHERWALVNPDPIEPEFGGGKPRAGR